MEILDGKKLSNEIIEELKVRCDELKEKGIKPKFAVIMVGNDKASQIYVKNKRKACEKVGIECVECFLDENIQQKELIDKIKELNSDNTIHGILLQSPIPKHLNINEAFETISPKKDVDGFNPTNVGKLCLNQNTFVSCTPFGIIKLLDKYDIDLAGKKVTIIGRSNIVGKPLIQCFLNKNATVTICHSKTDDIKEHTKDADIVVVAIGKPKFLKENMVKKNSVIIDVGINRDDNGKIIGDVDFENVSKKSSYITPVPGGVGPMTIAMLMNNVIKATKRQNGMID